jgi:exopolysaccharide biosynthesis polyprenyl glycosylphosphotransferase
VAAPDYVRPSVVPHRSPLFIGLAKLFQSHSVPGLLSALLDFITVLVAAGLAVRFRTAAPFQFEDWGGLPHLLHSSTGYFLTYIFWFATCLVFFMRSYGLYRMPQQLSSLHELRMSIHAVIVAGLILCGTLYLSNGAFISRIEILLTVLFTLILLTTRRMIRRHMVYTRHRAGIETRNVLIVGVGRVAHALRHHLVSLNHLGFRFKGFIAITPEEANSNDADIIGDSRNCLQIARSLFVDEIFLSGPADKQFVLSLVQEARIFGIDVRAVPDLYEGLAWNAPIEYIGQFPTIPLHRRDLPIGAFLAKRALDLTVASLGLLALAPFLAIIAIAIKFDSPGSVLYAAKRIGRKGRTFDCYKFRTMVENADLLKADLVHRNERDGILFKIANDPRITRFGQRLRKYSLDELPQLFNVIRGDMSLVGPRPPIASEVEQYDLSHLRRLDVLPGITGLWQVEARQDPSFESYISLDTAYVENWSLLLDLKILVRTVGVVITGTGS